MAAWTPEEDTVLKESYETLPKEALLAKLPGRIWRSVYKRSMLLHLSRPKDDAWKKEEDDLCVEFYPNTPYETLVPMFPGRTLKAIKWHAISVLRLTRSEEMAQLESKKTNQSKLGVDYPSQSSKVREKVKETVQRKYGVDNVFQSEEIKNAIEKTNIEKFGVKNPQQNKDIQRATALTNMDRYGVDNLFKMKDRVKEGLIEKYGQDNPQKVPEIREKTRQTNLERYGTESPAQNEDIKRKTKEILCSPEVREKKYETHKKNGTFMRSIEEETFYEYLMNVDPEAQHQVLHPEFKYMMDYYLPRHNLWVQYDGIYWHGKVLKEGYKQSINIQEVIKRDALQNTLIPNLIRFWSDDVINGIKTNTVECLIRDKIEDKLEELKKLPPVCHQYKKKLQFYNEDIGKLPFNPETIKASDFILAPEEITDEIIAFIERYEWLGSIGVFPKWCFAARYKGLLGGVLLINEPTAYSRILGDDTPKYEALIQRGASASWAPKNLGSRIVMYSCRWMVNNTEKRAFVGYADKDANERGIIYRACNFDYLGDDFGASEVFKHPSISRTFTRQYLYRTSTFKSWCRENKVLTEKSWFKENGFKNLENIPEEIKRSWYDWNNKIVKESEHVKINKKMKFALILGKDKREKKNLYELITYNAEPYPIEMGNSTKNAVIRINTGKTRSRKNSSKEQFIIDNYGKLTSPKMAKTLGETPRWVKRNLHRLTDEGKILRKSPNKPYEDLLKEDSWVPEIKAKAIHLRRDKLKSTAEICKELKGTFNFSIKPTTLGWWFKRFNCPFPTKEEWLQRFLPGNVVKELIEKKYRYVDIRNYLKDTYTVLISEDIISLYIRSLP